MRYLIVLISTLVVVACTAPSVTEQASSADHDHLLLSTLYVQHSAEYKALCRQTYRWAGYALANKLSERPEKPAIVLDIDETVLDNSPYSAWQIVNNQPYDKSSWMEWTVLAAADTVPGVTDFLHWADSMGVAIFYVSNRRVAELTPTLTNLQHFGLPQVDSTTVLLRDTTSSKVQRREAITQQGYNILLLCGDNLNDFAAVFEEGDGAARKQAVYDFADKWGDTWIVLPNPTYGAWDGALFDFNYDLSLIQRDSVRRSKLRSY